MLTPNFRLTADCATWQISTMKHLWEDTSENRQLVQFQALNQILILPVSNCRLTSMGFYSWLLKRLFWVCLLGSANPVIISDISEIDLSKQRAQSSLAIGRTEDYRLSTTSHDSGFTSHEQIDHSRTNRKADNLELNQILVLSLLYIWLSPKKSTATIDQPSDPISPETSPKSTTGGQPASSIRSIFRSFQFTSTSTRT